MTVQMRLFVLSLTHAGGPALAFVQRQIQMLLSDCQTDLALRTKSIAYNATRARLRSLTAIFVTLASNLSILRLFLAICR